MSIHASSWAKRQRTGDPVRKGLLMVLADYADEDGYCYASQARLALEVEVSERTVREHLGILEQAGHLRRHRRQDGLRRLPDGFYLNLEPELANPYRQVSPVAEPAENGSGNRQRAAGKNSKNSKVVVSSKDAPTGVGAQEPTFADCKAAYPKRRGGYNWKGAEKQWHLRRKGGHSAEYLFERTLAYADFCDEEGRTGTDKVLQASTFYGPDERFDEVWEEKGTRPAPRLGSGSPVDDDGEPWMQNLHTR